MAYLITRRDNIIMFCPSCNAMRPLYQENEESPKCCCYCSYILVAGQVKEEIPMEQKLTDQDMLDLRNRFTYHRPKNNQPERYENIRENALALAMYIKSNTPNSREQSLALTKLEETVMWANAAIARNE